MSRRRSRGCLVPVTARQTVTPRSPSRFRPANGHYGLMLLDKHKPTLHRGSPHHDHVRYLQAVMRRNGGANHRGIVIDGQFGHQTEDHLIDFQTVLRHAGDGSLRRQTWAVIDMLALK